MLQKPRLVLLLVLLLAGSLRIWGLPWGLPQVYEEATPLRKAWEMAGWGERSGLDLNPHFFNYPSLTLDLQLAHLGLLYLGMRATGTVEDPVDFVVRYETDPTPMVLGARALTALLGILTVGLVFLLGRRAAGTAAGALAATLLAFNPAHISGSQVVETDVPLTALVALGLWASLRLVDRPSRRGYLVAGACLGLAASAKYTGALLVVPLLVAHFLARRSTATVANPDPRDSPATLVNLVLAGVTSFVLFAATSPFVLLDAATAWRHLQLERVHMAEGHFGLDETNTLFYYARILGGRLLGWPAAAAALAGLVLAAGVRRRPWALVLASWVIPYGALVASWSMKGERYLYPLLPALLVFAVVAALELVRLAPDRPAPAPRRAVAHAAVLLVLGSIPAAALPGQLVSRTSDTRTAALAWIEAHLAPGALVVVEPLGPELLGPLDLWPLDPEVKRRILADPSRTPVYAVQQMPLLQVDPERSAPFYDLDLYGAADAVVINEAVAARYRANPERFAAQGEFYRRLEREWIAGTTFPPGAGSGPEVSIYLNPSREPAFAVRRAVPGPPELRLPPGRETGEEAFFYYNLGLNHETFGFAEAALACYGAGFGHELQRPGVHFNLSLGVVRVLMSLGRTGDAARFLERAIPTARTAAEREQLKRLHDQVRARAGG